ncbi:hypothetical protein L9F63_020502, partial [Diploptera punctata]
ISTRKKEVRAFWLQFISDSDDVNEIFRDTYIPINCEFVIVQANKDIIQLKEVYRTRVNLPLIIQDVGNWSRNNGLQWTNSSLHKRRNNLHGMVFKTALVKN